MPKLKAFILLFLSVSFLLTSNPSALAEDITITTYYPAPYGVYREIRSQRMAVGDTYYDSSQHCWPGGPCTFPDIDADADLIIEGNVGIGTVNPGEKLTVENGNVHIKDNVTDSKIEAILKEQYEKLENK